MTRYYFVTKFNDKNEVEYQRKYLTSKRICNDHRGLNGKLIKLCIVNNLMFNKLQILLYDTHPRNWRKKHLIKNEFQNSEMDFNFSVGT